MTVSSEIIFTIGLGNGVTTVWPFSFIIPYQADGVTPAVQVSILDTTVTPQTITALVPGEYAITGVGNDLGGTVIYTPALVSGKNILIARALDYVQEISILNQGFFPSTVEVIADNLEEQIQQVNSNTLRAITIPIFDLPLNMQLPVAADRASKFAAYDSLGRPIAVDLSAIPIIVATSSLQVFLSQSGTPVTQATLLAADAAAVALSAILVIDKNVTLSSNVTLLAKQVLFAGGVITRGVHTISGNFIEANTGIFDVQGASSGLVTFPRVPKFYLPTMWGAANDGVTDDSKAVQAAFNAATTFGGTVILRGSYLASSQLAVQNLLAPNITALIDGYGGRIKTSGAIYGLEVLGYSNNRGITIAGLTIDHNNASVVGSPGGIYCHGAQAVLLKECSVITSSAALGAGRTSYNAFKIDVNGGVNSLWLCLEDCNNYVPDDGSGYIATGILIQNSSNSAKIIRGRYGSAVSGLRLESDNGDANCLRIEDVAVEGVSNAGFYVLDTGGVTWPFGLVVNGLRVEPHNGGAYAIKVETVGAPNNSTEVPQFDNINLIGGATPAKYNVPSNFIFHTTEGVNGQATFAGAATKAVLFSAFGHVEANTNYRVALSGNVNETFWITSKATTGFTINSSNATSTAVVDWAASR